MFFFFFFFFFKCACLQAASIDLLGSTCTLPARANTLLHSPHVTSVCSSSHRPRSICTVAYFSHCLLKNHKSSVHPCLELGSSPSPTRHASFSSCAGRIRVAASHGFGSAVPNNSAPRRTPPIWNR
ncbi:hypothetical protein IWX50DRAFT_36589 [Phyllosticta citricarpa]|uniref:Secreted protein n=1 Tax=Phyllosticta citricarpa TaxID=55181 RepID=A0ABR1LYJ0_9PEZI